MTHQLYFGYFAGEKLCFQFRHSDTASYMEPFLNPKSEEKSDYIIYIPASDCDCWIEKYGMADDGNTEAGMSVYRASDALVKHDRIIIHAAAMLWREKAYLFSADSGTGKTTQLKNWLNLYGDEIKIMNGDKPILKFEDNGSVSVHPSPWKGKEEWGDDSLTASLGGIILLKQGNENSIKRMNGQRAAAFLLTQFFSMFETKEILFDICRLEEKLLSSVPVWLLINKGDPASASLTHDILLKELEGHV